jgi:hypothetical protein
MRRMRASLAESLLHLRDVAASATDSAFFDLAPTLSEICAHGILPGIFGRYFDLVFTLQKSQYSEAAKLFREIAELAVEEPGLAVLPFSGEALRNDMERYGRLLSLESGSWPILAPPSARPKSRRWVRVGWHISDQTRSRCATRLLQSNGHSSRTEGYRPTKEQRFIRSFGRKKVKFTHVQTLIRFVG